MKKVRKAIFPVGGLGTRFLPATKALPKEMLPVLDKPLIQYAVEEARDAGIEEFIFVTGRGKTAIEDHFDYSYELSDTLRRRGKDEDVALVNSLIMEAGRVMYVRQQDPAGLGHAVWCARHLIGDEPFAVILADDLILSERPCLAQMLDVYAEHGGNVVAAMEVSSEHTSRYGILDITEEAEDLVKVKGMVEKPTPDAAPSRLAIIGRYILQPQVLEFLGTQKPGAIGEIQLTDALAMAAKTQSFYGLKFEGTRFDCGDKMGMLSAQIAFALERPEMRQELLYLMSQLVKES